MMRFESSPCFRGGFTSALLLLLVASVPLLLLARNPPSPWRYDELQPRNHHRRADNVGIGPRYHRGNYYNNHGSGSYSHVKELTPKRARRVRTYSAAGKLRSSEVLSAAERKKLDASDDSLFYGFPRMVQHVDESFLAQLTQLYRKLVPSNADVIDLCTAFDSHLPPEITYNSVVGHGMNEKELAANPRLHRFYTRNLNEDPTIDLGMLLNSVILSKSK
mmetsp:Transcript_31533/g.51221  ORF Transcript_31533/g.51221 Transcript_31533/m.51221 type:complete len:219 (-) Transcript_31533:1142-1798(-)